jgi:hypothetical protein
MHADLTVDGRGSLLSFVSRGLERVIRSGSGVLDGGVIPIPLAAAQA